VFLLAGIIVFGRDRFNPDPWVLSPTLAIPES
jgi:hypothetical protein